VGREDLPKEQRKLENDVRDIENGRKPRVLAAGQVQVSLHTRNLGIANISTVNKRQHIWDIRELK
jgi:hypothetical protein